MRHHRRCAPIVAALVLPLALVAGHASAQLVNFSADFEGSVNGSALAGSGGGMIDLGQMGGSNGEITFSAVSSGFNPLATSLISNLCANAFAAQGGSQNLFTLSGGNYHMTRAFQWVGLEGSAVIVDSNVQYVAGEGFFSYSSVLGTYNGPTDIVGIQSYSVTWLPSSAEGEFFESGAVVLERASGDTLIMQFASVFSGLENSLEQVQYGTGLFDTSFDGTVLRIAWDGEFQVPAPGVPAFIAGAALIATRRRRA